MGKGKAVGPGGWVLVVNFKSNMGQIIGQARSKPVTGEEAMVGETAEVKASFAAGESGSVFLMGEWWNAELASGSVETGDTVRVLRMDGYTLIVEPIEDADSTTGGVA